MTDVRLTRCELELMDVLWKRGRGTVQDVTDALPRPLAYTTVMTTLTLLESRKKVLQKVKQGRAFVYEPVVSREEVSRSMLGEVREVLFGGSLSSLVVNLLQEDRLTPDDVESLRSALDQLQGPQ